MKEIRIRIRILSIVLVLLLLTVVVYASYNVAVYGNRWLSNGRNARISKNNVIAGSIFDTHNVLLRHSDSNGNRIADGGDELQSSLVHVLGDTEGRVANAVESFQARHLYGFDTNVIQLIKDFVSGEKRRGNDIALTIDSKLQLHAVNAFNNLEKSKGKNGAIVVMNYKTGEILTLASMPIFNPFNITYQDKVNTNKPFFNRATQSKIPPGSTFKLITMAAAINNDKNIINSSFTCNGSINVDGALIHDAGNVIHNNINIFKALEQSCNSVFANIAIKLGNYKLCAMAESFGFNQNFLFKDIVVENSLYPSGKLSNFELATAGIGQSKILTSPLHMCMVASTIANNGIMMEPYILKSVNVGRNIQFTKPNTYKLVLDVDICHNIQKAMLAVVNSGTGVRAKSAPMQIAGKTGTVQGNVDGKAINYAWFIGYSINKPYAVSVLVEDGVSGAQAAAPIAAHVFDYLAK